MNLTKWKDRRKKRQELVVGQIISIKGIDDGPFKIVDTFWIEPDLALSLIDGNNCRIAARSKVDEIQYHLHGAGTALGNCTHCQNPTSNGTRPDDPT